MPIVVAAIAVAGYIGQADRDDAGAIVGSGSVPADELRVGDCFDDGETSDEAVVEISEVAAIPCDEPHDNEVFHTFELTDASLPSDEAMLERIGTACIEAFDAFVGAPYATSELDLFPIWPAQGSWDAGDRTAICSVYRMDGAKLTATARGSGL